MGGRTLDRVALRRGFVDDARECSDVDAAFAETRHGRACGRGFEAGDRLLACAPAAVRPRAARRRTSDVATRGRHASSASPFDCGSRAAAIARSCSASAARCACHAAAASTRARPAVDRPGSANASTSAAHAASRWPSCSARRAHATSSIAPAPRSVSGVSAGGAVTQPSVGHDDPAVGDRELPAAREVIEDRPLGQHTLQRVRGRRRVASRRFARARSDVHRVPRATGSRARAPGSRHRRPGSPMGEGSASASTRVAAQSRPGAAGRVKRRSRGRNGCATYPREVALMRRR